MACLPIFYEDKRRRGIAQELVFQAEVHAGGCWFYYKYQTPFPRYPAANDDGSGQAA